MATVIGDLNWPHICCPHLNDESKPDRDTRFINLNGSQLIVCGDCSAKLLQFYIHDVVEDVARKTALDVVKAMVS